jgi:ligand-binding sensor domain-containing protein
LPNHCFAQDEKSAHLEKMSVNLSGASAPNFSYELLNTSQGLPSAEILTLEKDFKGYLWIGTTIGISKYDGYSFENFQNSSDSELIGRVNAIKEDEHHRLWIGTEAGLFVQTNNRIYKVSDKHELIQGVNAIWLEKDGLWLGTESGPAYLNENAIQVMEKKGTINLKNFILPSWNKLELEKMGIIRIHKSKDSTYYFVGYSALYQYDGFQLKSIYNYRERNDIVSQLMPENKNKIYFFTASHIWNKIENGLHTRLAFGEIYKPDSNPEGEAFWVLGPHSFYLFYPATGLIKTEISLQQEGVVWPCCLLADLQNNIWIATHNGLLKFKPTFFQHYPPKVYGLPEEIYSINETSDGAFLLGSNRGKVMMKAGNTFRPVFQKKSIVSLAEVFAIYEDENKWLWFATGYQGIVLFRNNKLENFAKKNGLRDNSNYYFYKSSKDQLFLVGDHGLSEIITHPAKKNVLFKNYYHYSTFTKYAEFYSCIEAPDGKIWIGGQEGIFFLYNDSLHLFHLLNMSLSVTDIKEGKKGIVWISTQGQGVLKCVFNKNNQLELQHQFTERDGLNTNVFNKILIDRNGDTWISSYKGISFINADATRIINFDGNDGFMNTSFNKLFLYQDKKGIIWTGSSKGITSFDPEKITLPVYKPPVYITEVTLTNSREDIYQFSESKSENLPVNLILPYNRNYLKFQFGAVDFSNQENLQYFYKLEGIDSGWLSAEHSRFVIYQHLSPGKFIFHVKAENNKGIWSQQDAVFSFTILLPFWQTWWFITVTALLFICLIILLVRRRIKQIRKEGELKNKITVSQMQALRAQMNPHFIFNSLNSINRFILQNNKAQASEYLTKFSRLIRLILQNSQAALIPLESELEALALYLELESLRFDHHFEFKISIEEDLDVSVLKVPPLIIQPYAENAIWHGLMHKEEKGQLEIELFQQADVLCCRITDDGIGRKKSAELKSKSGSVHKSTGMKITASRIEMLQQKKYRNADVKITDLILADGTIGGTEVVLKIPACYD